MRFINLAGQRFGRLTVVSREPVATKRTHWLCQCDCGNSTIADAVHLSDGHTKSCGCFREESRKIARRKHGHHPAAGPSPEYNSWAAMHQRCRNKNCKAYPDYGGRGIKICTQWGGHDGFAQFLKDLGRRPKGDYSLERIDNDGDYCPRNCRWANRAAQSRNKRSTKMLHCNGESLCLSDWAVKIGLRYATISDLLNHGWTIEEIVNHKPT